jgi:hypothetical protein
VQKAYGKLPISFEPNVGQTDPEVDYISRGGEYTLFLTPTEAVLSLSRPSSAQAGAAATRRADSSVLRMQLVGGNPGARAVGTNALPGKANYLVGSDPAKWRTNVPTYGRVEYQRVYPGVDMVYYGNQQELEYDFVLAPGADPGAIALGFQGADRPRIASNGDLVLSVGGRGGRQLAPYAYQEVDGVRRQVSSRYALGERGRVRFELGAYDHTRPLVIDPVISYSTYIGGSQQDLGRGIAVDRSGNVYVTGGTGSANFPKRNAYQSTFGGVFDVFVLKLNPTGTGIIYSTYLGGSEDEVGNGIAVDQYGRAYVTGITISQNFPVSSGAFDRTPGGGNCSPDPSFPGPCPDAFVAQLYATGAGIFYSSYLGGSGEDSGEDIAVDTSGNAYVAGRTSSGNFPTTVGAYDRTLNDAATVEVPGDAFVTKVRSLGTRLLYSTYLGGKSFDTGSGIAILPPMDTQQDDLYTVYVTGSTSSTNFPTTAGARDRTYNGGNLGGDVFVTRLTATGSGLLYSTYIGGSSEDYGEGIAVDSSGNAYVTGQTESSNFPTTAGARDRTCGTDGACNRSSAGGAVQPDAYVSKLNTTGSALVYSTYVGGSGTDVAYDVALNAAGNAHITGFTESADFPRANAFQTTRRGGTDAFITKLTLTGGGLVYSSYLGGSAGDERGREGESGNALTVGPDGGAYITGGVISRDFPTTAGAYDRTHNGGPTDVFVTKVR